MCRCDHEHLQGKLSTILAQARINISGRTVLELLNLTRLLKPPAISLDDRANRLLPFWCIQSDCLQTTTVGWNPRGLIFDEAQDKAVFHTGNQDDLSTLLF